VLTVHSVFYNENVTNRYIKTLKQIIICSCFQQDMKVCGHIGEALVNSIVKSTPYVFKEKIRP